MLAVGGLPVFNVVVVKFYINCMVAINRCMIVLVLILIYTSLTVNYSYLRIIRLTMVPMLVLIRDITLHRINKGEWFNGKTAAFKVADLGSRKVTPRQRPVSIIFVNLILIDENKGKSTSSQNPFHS